MLSGPGAKASFILFSTSHTSSHVAGMVSPSTKWSGTKGKAPQNARTASGKCTASGTFCFDVNKRAKWPTKAVRMSSKVRTDSPIRQRNLRHASRPPPHRSRLP